MLMAYSNGKEGSLKLRGGDGVGDRNESPQKILYVTSVFRYFSRESIQMKKKR